MFNITVLTFVDRVSCFHSLVPFFESRDPRFRFTYTADPDWCMRSDKNDILVMVRQFIKPDFVDIGLLKALHAKYSRVAFFHDDAGGGIPRLEILPFVDLFYAKALFKDRGLYSRQLYGKELYSDYYHRRYGIADPDSRDRAVCADPGELNKLRLSWNIGIGDYPRGKLRQRAGVAAARVIGPRASRLFRSRAHFPADAPEKNRGTYPVHARIGLISRPSISYQRKLILDRVSGDPRFLTGYVSQSRFNREMRDSRISLSPFGWGELCLRDFETVRAGALLLKPDMSHLETWPDVFVPGVTYAPFDWDADNLVERAAYYLDHEGERMAVARAALDAYASALSALPDRFSKIMEEICR